MMVESGCDTLPSSEMLAYGWQGAAKQEVRVGRWGGTAQLSWKAGSWATLLMQKLPQNPLKLPAGAFLLEADGLPWASHLKVNPLP